MKKPKEYAIDQHLIPFKKEKDGDLPKVLEVKVISENPVNYLVISHKRDTFESKRDLTNKEISHSDLLGKLREFGLAHFRYERKGNQIQVYYTSGSEI